MDREGFRNRLKQYKEAKGFDPLLKYWDWKLKYDSAPQPDSMPSQPQPDLPTVTSQPLDDRAHRWDNGYSNVNRDPFDSPYDDARYHDYRKPRIELRKGNVYYSNPNYLKWMGRFGKVLRGGSILGEAISQLFPSEEAELIEDLRIKMDKQNKWLTGLEDIPKYDEGTDAVMGPITYDEWIRQLRKKPNIVENEDDEKLIQLIRKKSNNFLYLRNRTNEQGMIPFIEEKAITLSNAGKDTGVRLSTNMLDSIAKYADKADISLQDALGLAGQESTFGKGYFLDQSAITPSVLVSDWSYSDDMLSVDRTENPYVGLMRAAQQKHDSGGYDKSGRFIIYNPDYIKALRGGLPFADKEAKRLRTDIPVLEHAFRKYKSGLYNPNDPNHTRMVEERGKALMKSPEILKWMKESKFIPENKINFAEGGEVTEEGGWTEDYWSKANREAAHKDLDPTMRFSPETLLFDNGATGEENEYWKAYLGLDNTVPKMNKNAYTEWDMQIEAEKKKNGELLSDFYGTTPNMDLSLQAVADTLYLGKLSREYDMYSKTYEDLPSKKEIDSLYKQSKQVMDNPGKWQQMYSDENIIKRTSDKDHGEINPLGMLAHYGMKWVPEENALYVHDTYDFPWYARWAGKIKERPKEMKIRSKIEFNPKKGSKLLRSAENYNNAYK